MNDTIYRQAAIDEITAYKLDNVLPDELESKGFNDGIDLAITLLSMLPSAQPERETAKFIRWMECEETAKYISYTPHCKCSKCGTEFLIETIKYCYMCGARMER